MERLQKKKDEKKKTKQKYVNNKIQIHKMKLITQSTSILLSY